MLFVLLDEPTLFVFDSPEAVTRRVEAIDIEHSLRIAYDETGREYDVEWIKQNSYSTFGPIKSVTNGECRLVPSDRLNPTALADLLANAEYVDPPDKAAAVRECGRKLAECRTAPSN